MPHIHKPLVGDLQLGDDRKRKERKRHERIRQHAAEIARNGIHLIDAAANLFQPGNDGTTFGHREGRLPRQPRGYYTEWVVRTEGIRNVGPQRLITGRGGEAYYTPDHYETFVTVRPPS